MREPGKILSGLLSVTAVHVSVSHLPPISLSRLVKYTQLPSFSFKSGLVAVLLHRKGVELH